MNGYTSTRVRGLAPWNPHAATEERMEDVEAVFEEYADHRPLTIRQVLYRLVAQYDWTKEDYDKLQNYLNRARRSGRIPFHWIRDDEFVQRAWGGYSGVPDFWRSTANRARDYQRKRQEGQPRAVEIWVESAGMIPHVTRVSRTYHVPVCSRGGFESTTAKYDAAQRFAERDRPTVVLELGDHDPSGLSRLDALTEDIKQMVSDLPGPHGGGWVTFERVAVTPEQIEDYRLPVKEANPNDRRGDWTGPVVQAEALAPDDLASEVQPALQAWTDPVMREDVLERERRERAEIIETARALVDGEG